MIIENNALSADPLLRPAHLTLATGLGEASLNAYVRDGRIPPPDVRGRCSIKLWRISTIRRWNPAIADLVEPLLKNPAFPTVA